MKPRTHQQDSQYIVYDADRIQQPDASWFDVDRWHSENRVTGEAEGRGSAWFLDWDSGPVVLRHYYRGGMAAKISRDQYLFTGFENSRPAREFDILARLRQESLPVPEPVAALCRREGAFYRGTLVTAAIPGVTPFADWLTGQGQHPEADVDSCWRRVGKTIRRFHDHGVVHADLNARNILLQEGGSVWLIDFDRARIAPDSQRAFRANLDRLHRSLLKFLPAGEQGLDSGWQALIEAYES